MLSVEPEKAEREARAHAADQAWKLVLTLPCPECAHPLASHAETCQVEGCECTWHGTIGINT
jgi:hypothetical protein